MLYKEAKEIADEVVAQLEPHCIRIQIAGSIRRKRPEVKDIEVVAIPKPYHTGLFASGVAAVVGQWQKVKGELDYDRCKYTQRILPQGIKLDLFFARPENWGLILAIRTGSAEYSHRVLASTWKKRGYRSEGGMLYSGKASFAVPEEVDLFRRIGLEFVDPEKRELDETPSHLFVGSIGLQQP